MDVKAVGAVLVYVVIVLTSTALTGGAGLHTGERRLKYGHFFAQTLYRYVARLGEVDCNVLSYASFCSGSYPILRSVPPVQVHWRSA